MGGWGGTCVGGDGWVGIPVGTGGSGDDGVGGDGGVKTWVGAGRWVGA